jgi:Fe-Mn family superoxide dismutase
MYEPKTYDHLLGTPGFSDQLLKNHFALYQGYVKNVNVFNDELDALLREGKAGTPAYAELTRRFGWEFNGMRLHELYFGNMTKTATPPIGEGPLSVSIRGAYGTYENWEKDFRAVSGMRGIGWAILYYDPVGHQIFNVWVNEHDQGHLAGAVPLLVLDVFEHAYTLDYGIKRADYIEAFFKAVDWSAVAKRFARPNAGQ